MDAGEVLSDLRERVEEEYRKRTPRSGALHRHARDVLPGGGTRTGTVFAPYPVYFECGKGSYLYDVDGNRFLDFTNNATSLIHGHAHPAIVNAIRRQAGRGTAWAAPNPHQLRLGEVLCARLPGIERVRFCNSVTEANMQAIKAAPAFSGKDGILMMDGAYQGAYEGLGVHVEVALEFVTHSSTLIGGLASRP